VAHRRTEEARGGGGCCGSVSDTSRDGFAIRPAAASDIPVILTFIKELADYERLSHAVTATEAGLTQALFGPKPGAEVLLGELDGQPVGFALFFPNFSTFVGRPGLYLEDLFVRPEFRGRGFGTRFLIRLAQIAVERDYGRMEWAVLDWNEMALRVYRKIGAEGLQEWTVHRLAGDALQALSNLKI
jgi:GNAT superfamily N-acetyltransferase